MTTELDTLELHCGTHDESTRVGERLVGRRRPVRGDGVSCVSLYPTFWESNWLRAVMRNILGVIKRQCFARGEATESSWLDSASAGMLDAEQGDGDLDDVKLITLLAPDEAG